MAQGAGGVWSRESQIYGDINFSCFSYGDGMQQVSSSQPSNQLICVHMCAPCVSHTFTEGREGHRVMPRRRVAQANDENCFCIGFCMLVKQKRAKCRDVQSIDSS